MVRRIGQYFAVPVIDVKPHGVAHTGSSLQSLNIIARKLNAQIPRAFPKELTRGF